MLCLLKYSICFLFVGCRHRIESGVWGREILGYYNGKGHTIRSAIDLWYNHSEESLVFRDACSGPHCSNTCPEQIALSQKEEAENWSSGVKIAIAAVVLLIGVICLIMKVLYSVTFLFASLTSHFAILLICNCKLLPIFARYFSTSTAFIIIPV